MSYVRRAVSALLSRNNGVESELLEKNFSSSANSCKNVETTLRSRMSHCTFPGSHPGPCESHVRDSRWSQDCRLLSGANVQEPGGLVRTGGTGVSKAPTGAALFLSVLHIELSNKIYFQESGYILVKQYAPYTCSFCAFGNCRGPTYK